MHYMLYIWLGVFCVTLLMEGLNAGTLVSVWFSVGSLIPLIMSFFTPDTALYISLQVAIFGIVTTLCLVFLRKIAKKWLFKNKDEKTNMDLYVGKKLKVVAKHDNIPYIKFNGIEYRAILDNDSDELDVGEMVEIIRFQGNKAIVREIKE